MNSSETARPIDVDDDEPVTLREACQLFFKGRLTPSALRREAGRGNLNIIQIARKDFVTRRAIEEMKQLCLRSASRPELWLRKDSREGRSDLWFILDTDENGKQLHIATGCTAAQTKEAAEALADYISGKHVVKHGGHSEEVKLADVLSVYLDEKAPKASDPKLTTQIIVRLNEFFGDKPVIAIKAKLCQEFEQWRGTQSGARRDLEILRAAVNYYQEQHGLSVVPKFTMPAKSLPRDTYLTRSEAAALLWAALGWKRIAPGKWVRDHVQDYRGLYSTSSRGRRYYYAWRRRAEIARRAGEPRIHGCLQPGACLAGRPEASAGHKRRKTPPPDPPDYHRLVHRHPARSDPRSAEGAEHDRRLRQPRDRSHPQEGSG